MHWLLELHGLYRMHRLPGAVAVLNLEHSVLRRPIMRNSVLMLSGGNVLVNFAGVNLKVLC